MSNRKLPIVTIIILILNILGLVYEFKVGQTKALILYGMFQGAIEDGEYLRVVVSAFLHIGVLHFGSNMICLFVYGLTLERQIGSLKFAFVYVVSIIGSGVLINYLGGGSIHAGASGAIWGLMTASLVYNLNHYLNPALALRGIITNLIYSFSANVSWQGHIGGGIAGLIAALFVCGNNSDFIINAKKKEEGDSQ